MWDLNSVGGRESREFSGLLIQSQCLEVTVGKLQLFPGKISPWCILPGVFIHGVVTKDPYHHCGLRKRESTWYSDSDLLTITLNFLTTSKNSLFSLSTAQVLTHTSLLTVLIIQIHFPGATELLIPWGRMPTTTLFPRKPKCPSDTTDSFNPAPNESTLFCLVQNLFSFYPAKVC